ncbi:peroxidase 12 [Argentina anserina]|uniref:peroxidase 12 n=1 Tax=Argentina anserina TaxID=57926 RepID=UPI0021762D3D|nr:peroxidase 12 [Potentilla anserina]
MCSTLVVFGRLHFSSLKTQLLQLVLGGCYQGSRWALPPVGFLVYLPALGCVLAGLVGFVGLCVSVLYNLFFNSALVLRGDILSLVYKKIAHSKFRSSIIWNTSAYKKRVSVAVEHTTTKIITMASFASLCSLLLIVSYVSYFCTVSEAQPSVPVVKGLSWSFYETSCPKLDSIVRKQLKKVFKEDIGQAAGLLRLHFHDCFVQGCDGSVLLDGSASGPSEQQAPPNLSLRAKAFEIINDLRERVHSKCGRVVSCADITALAARDAVFLSGGPDYEVPLGRKDGLNFATRNETLANLPPPTSNTTKLLTDLAKKNLDATDVVALSGGHTIGLGHCTSFTGRLYPQDPTMDKTFANDLKEVCPTATTNATTVLDIRSPDTFDNKYYVDLMNRQGLFTSDQDLYTDKRTRDIVKSFAVNQTLFFEKFVHSMIKMGQLSVLTGSKGEIRADCSVRNSDNANYLRSVVEEDEESLSEL